MRLRNGLNLKRYFEGMVCGVILLTAGAGWSAGSGEKGAFQPQPTPFSMDFYGYIQGLVVGDRITVYDPAGVLCGEFTVRTAGQYGFLHVYGDVPATGIDEGAEIGDILTFKLNDIPLEPLSGTDILWVGDGERLRVDFIGR